MKTKEDGGREKSDALEGKCTVEEKENSRSGR